MEDKAYTHLFNDILGKTLQLSENPSQFGEYLTQQIRELIGARIIIVAVVDEAHPSKIFSVFPVRKTEWANQNMVIKLVTLSFDFETIQYLQSATCPENIALLLKSLEIDNLIAIPLIAANRKVGSILLLDIMDLNGIESIMSLLTRLSGVFALVIRNSNFYQTMENQVITRTIELKKRNNELLEREQELIRFNEEYEVLNEELTENINKTEEINKQLVEAIHRAEKSELQARDILQTAMDGYWAVDLQGRIKDTNEISCKTLGYSRAELLNMNIADIVSAVTKDEIKTHFEKIIKKGEDRFESKLRRKNGQIIRVELSAKMRPTQNLIVAFFHDITKRKQAEETLRKSEALYRNLVEELPDGVYKSTHEGKFVDVNPAMVNMLGYSSKEELMAIDIKTQLYFSIEDRESVVLQEKYKETGIYRMKKKDGSEIWVEDHGWLNLDKKSNILYHEGIMRDVTERRRAELDLQNKNEELNIKNTFIQTILDNLPIGLSLHDIHQGETTYMNKKFEEIYGWASNEIKTVDLFFEKVYPDETYRKQLMNRVMADINSGDPKRMHWENSLITGKDGSQRIVNSVNIPLTEQNTMVSTVMDITELHHIQNDLKQAKEKAEESDRLKSAFLANMSHEIRTPMNGILGFAQLLKEQNLTGYQQKEYIRIIEKSGVRMLNIINDIVDISKIESGQMKVHLTETNVNDQLEYLHHFFKTEAENNGLKLFVTNNLPKNETTIVTDREKLYAILTNLIKNAIKYTNEGSIEFGCKIVQMVHEPSIHESSIQFYVKDTGIGVPIDRQEAIFDRFIQADIADKMARQGAGLGLSISKAYVEMMGGKMWVESQEKVGSTFYFTLPYQPGTTEEQPIKNELLADKDVNPEDLNVSRLKIVIAEDDEASTEYMSILLQKFVKEIIKVKTGTKAVEACRNHPDIDLVLMDIKMPEMDGYEATRQIRKFNTKVRIVAQTAYALTGDENKAIEAGCDGYLSKPIKKEELLNLFEKSLFK